MKKNESNAALLAFFNNLPQFSKHCIVIEKVLNGNYYFLRREGLS